MTAVYPVTTPESVAALCGGRLVIPAADAAVILGFRSANGFREALRRGRLLIAVMRRGQDIYVSAAAIADYINKMQTGLERIIEEAPKFDPETEAALKKQGREIAAKLVFREPDDVVKEIAAKIAKQHKRRVAKLPPETPPTGGLDW